MRYTARVIPGQGRGKTLGFPTFNLQIPDNFMAKPGIYAGYVWVDSHQYLGAFHFGPIPVFSDPDPHLEVFVLEYLSNHPVTSVTFELVKHLRPIRNFASPAALAAQISLDVAQVRATLN